MFYLVIFIGLLVISQFEILGMKFSAKNKWQLFVCSIFILVAGLRYETGVDWRGYQDYYNQIPSMDMAIIRNNTQDIFVTLDVGYALLNSFLKMLGGGLQTIFFIISFAISTLLLINVKSYSKYVLIGFILYYSYFFFVFDMSGIRQGLALQIFIFSLRYIGERKFGKYVAMIALASSIHWSALLLVPLYFILNFKASKIFSLIFIIIGTIIFSFQIKMISGPLNWIAEHIQYFPLLQDKIVAHTSNEVLSNPRQWDLYSIYNYVRCLIIIILCNKYDIKLAKNIKYYNIFYNLLLLQFFSLFYLYEFTVISERIRFYFLFSEIILVPNLIFCFRYLFEREITFIIFSAIAFLNSYPYLLGFKSTVSYTPYQNYLIYQLFDIHSDGDARLDEHMRTHDYQ